MKKLLLLSLIILFALPVIGFSQEKKLTQEETLKQIQEYRAREAAAKEKITALEADIAKLKEEIADLESKVAALKTEIADLQAKIDAIKKKYEKRRIGMIILPEPFALSKAW